MKIINRIGGGLGNQMFNYALCEKWAAELGARQVYDVTDFFVFKYLVPCGVHARTFGLYGFKGPRKYRTWRWQWLSLPIWIIGKKVGWGVFDAILKAMGIHWRHCDDVFNPVFPPIPQGCKTIYYSGINCAPALLPDRKTLMEEFSPAEGTLDEKTISLEREILACESVAIHVRRTDYLIQETSWALSFDYYIRAISYVKGKVANPSWFVFSDDPEWCKSRFAPLLGNFAVVEGNAGNPVADMHLMSRCKHHIIANSTFSWWGAYLAPASTGLTLCPERWGPYVEALPETFFPAEWIKIECD